MYDEPEGVPTSARDHYSDCTSCQERFRQIAGDAHIGSRLLAVPAAAVDVDGALRSFRSATTEVPAARQRPAWQPALNVRRLVRPLALVAAVGLLGLTVMSSGLAQSALQVFEVKQVKPVTVTEADLRSLPDLSAYGDANFSPSEISEADATTAATKTGLSVPVVSNLPSGMPSQPRYAVVNQVTGTFTFRAEKAKAEAAKRSKPLPNLPANIDGSTLTLTAGPAIAMFYGDLPSGVGVPSGDGKAPPSSQTGQAPAAQPRPAPGGNFLVVKSVAPKVTSTKASVKDIENYLVSLPGVSDNLKTQIRGLEDPASTLPIPIPADYATSHPVRIDASTSGVAIGDNSGFGSFVIFVKAGIVYGVGGTVKEDQVLPVATSLR
jgi:hypothetical protein